MRLADTGVLYALADRDDAWHARAVELARTTSGRWLTPITVVPEAAYLIQTRLGAAAERKFVGSIVAQELAVESISTADWTRAAELLERYPVLGMVDATVVAVAERLRLSTIATTDRRHFGMVRPRHRDAFILVP